MQPACLGVLPPGPRLRPDWYPTGTVIVADPLYGDVSLVLSLLPLHCWKSGELPDGSYWMWLSIPDGKTTYSPTSGALFFALSWEYWVSLKFLATNPATGVSTFHGGEGNGRIEGVSVDIVTAP